MQISSLTLLYQRYRIDLKRETSIRKNFSARESRFSYERTA
ncbi:hypothetical protein B4098_2934 [Heyndrickxia coagulans]|uniref:Uncharacterized protein n=1 Tax=Heyndrickxia coagulans TaxID=1398 RepID=A0A150JT39_HEYCO|nr:hypothetical protein B4098_2934 [Heyndrickxia coagulans]